MKHEWRGNGSEHMTLAVIGLDAADYRLVKEWDLDNLLLDNHTSLETFSHSRDFPLTAEVWPTIATGKMPKETGAGRRGSDWGGMMSVLESISTRIIPQEKRAKVGRYMRSGKTTREHFGVEEMDDHPFEAVYNWPGVTPAKNWSSSEEWLKKYYDNRINDEEFFQIQMGLTGEEFGWLNGMAMTGLGVVAVRSHILDHLGHAWAKQPEKLRKGYEKVNELVGEIRSQPHVSELLICSDHGMTTPLTDESNYGRHSWHAMVSSTFDEDLPGHVNDVKSWIDDVGEYSGDQLIDSRTSKDTTAEHLKDLGYL